MLSIDTFIKSLAIFFFLKNNIFPWLLNKRYFIYKYCIFREKIQQRFVHTEEPLGLKTTLLFTIAFSFETNHFHLEIEFRFVQSFVLPLKNNNNVFLIFVFEDDFKQGVHMASSSIDGPLSMEQENYLS